MILFFVNSKKKSREDLGLEHKLRSKLISVYKHTVLIIRYNGIETVCQQNNPSNSVKHRRRIQNVPAKNGNVKKRNKIIWYPSDQKKSVVFRMIYNLKNSSPLWWNWQLCKKIGGAPFLS